MVFTKLIQLVTIAALGTSQVAQGHPSKPLIQLEGFDIAKEPSKEDWRYFIRAPEAARDSLWAYHAHNGKQLKDWAWGWRLGWIRVCASNDKPLCSRLLGEALADRALVVRAEAATRVGQHFEGSADDGIIKALAAAYHVRRNLRHGKPLYIMSRLLFALHQVGGAKALATAKSLAGEYPETAAYWARLEGSAARVRATD